MAPRTHPQPTSISNGISIGSAVFAQLMEDSPYPLQWAQIAYSYGSSSLPSTWFLWPTLVHNTKGISIGSTTFGRPFVKRFALCYQLDRFHCLSVCLSVCPVCLSVGDVGVLWPNGWMDQNQTWHAGSKIDLGHVQLPLSKKGGAVSQFPAHFYCAKRLDGSRCHLLRR